jgi:hypothetical protein
MKRFAAVGLLAVLTVLTISVAAQEKRVPLDIRTLSTRPELVTGGDVLLQIIGPATLTAKNVRVLVNGKDASAAFKPAADSKAPISLLVGLVSGLNVGSNTIVASTRGDKASAQLTVINHPITGPVLYSPHQTPFICETQAVGLGAPARRRLLRQHEGRLLLSIDVGRRAARGPGGSCRFGQRERLRRRPRQRSGESVQTARPEWSAAG